MKSMKRGDRRAEPHRHATRRVRLDRAGHRMLHAISARASSAAYALGSILRSALASEIELPSAPPARRTFPVGSNVAVCNER